MSKSRIGVYEIWACLIILGATALRFYFAYRGWPQSNSDEGTMGLEALHIAFKGEHPFILYGQDYMGVIEAYLGALMFRIFGPSLLALHLGLLLIFALFLGCLYLLTSFLYNKRLAIVTLLLMVGGSSEILFRQIQATGGYPEGMVFGALLLLLAGWFALRNGSEGRRWSYTSYVLWGMIAGLAFWSDLLMGPFILAGGLVLLGWSQRKAWLPISALLLLGFVLGFSPYLAYKLATPPDQTTMHAFTPSPAEHGKLHYTSDTGKPVPPPNFGQQIEGALLITLPIATGANAVCPLTAEKAWPLSAQTSAATWRCTTVHGTWGLVLISLWFMAVIGAVKQLRRLRTEFGGLRKTAEERRYAIVLSTRLALLGSAALTLILFICIPASGVTPWSSSRYLMGLMIATPAVLAPLWDVNYGYKRAKRWLAPLVLFGKYAVFAWLIIALCLAAIDSMKLIPGAYHGEQQEQALIADLLHHHINHIYSDYWTCDRAIFESGEQVLCFALDDQLGQTALNRYPAYARAVASDVQASYAFTINSLPARVFAADMLRSVRRYSSFKTNGYIVYQPLTGE